MLQLATERLLLRDFRAEDLPAYVRLRAAMDPFGHEPEEDSSPQRAEELLDLFLSWAAAAPRHRFQLAIVLPDSGELIGSCGVRLTSEEHREGSFGCELGAAFRGRGYAQEAARRILHHGFAELGLHRIYAETAPGNDAARKLALRLGFRQEGVLRQNRFLRGRWRDTCLLALLAEEWA